MELSINDILQYPPIIGVTINTVMLSPAFRTLLYSIIAVVGLGAIGYMLFKRKSAVDSLRHAGVAVFFTAGLLYAAHADIGWATWVNTDIDRYASRTTEEKLFLNDPGINKFVHSAKQIIPNNYIFLSSLFGTLDAYVVLRTEYLLLPLQKRKDSDYIIVMLDREAQYDPMTRTLSHGDTVIQNLDLIYQFAPEAYILRKGS